MTQQKKKEKKGNTKSAVPQQKPKLRHSLLMSMGNGA